MIFVFDSCTVQRRVHRKGWFVQWNVNQSQNRSVSHEKSASVRESKSENEAEILVTSTSSIRQLHSDELKSNDDIKEKIVDTEVSQESEATSESDQPTIVKGEEVYSPDTKRQEESEKMPFEFKLDAMSPTRVPILAWILLGIGILLVSVALVLGIIYLVVNGALIGAPLYLGLMLVGGIIFVILATQTAMASMKPQPSAPDPRYQREEPKREKKEREPLNKSDKIFLAVIGGLALIIGITLFTF